MKKFLILSAVLALSACSCMDDVEEEADPVVYQAAKNKAEDMNCDYFDGKTCYRYVRRTQRIVAPAPVLRYREVVTPPAPQYVVEPQYVAPAPVVVQAPCPQVVASAPVVVPAPCQQVVAPAPVVVPATDCGGCAPKVSQTREPVEVTYKKTTYTTVYKPETSASVAYEKVPYNGGAQDIKVEVATPQVVQTDSETDILLNVK